MSYNKYGAKKVCCYQGHKHDSKKEAHRCNELHFLQKGRVISDLQVQVPFELLPSKKYDNMPNERGIKYVADFVYTRNGITYIEDTKGMKTLEYIIKRKLVKDKYCGERVVFKEV
ncbi:MAG: DUF1064 domain-containing protein [Ruminococcus sp.]|nr:DUF1064 domain-containing protein [Ruminococcus sp.]